MAKINRAIRFYQPNDPYYWQVDNLPLTDLLDNDIVLEERIGLLEDFVTGFNNNCRGVFGVAALADLKAYTEELDGLTQNFGKVFVRPGKFTARMQIPATKETGWRMMRDDDDYFNNTDFAGLGGLNTTTLSDDFVRYTRGTGRTSVVEFNANLNGTDKFVVVPSFDAAEFNSNSAPAERLDLIYITAHEALDTVGSDVNLQPTIGIIKGAYFRTDSAAGLQANGPRFENPTGRRAGRITGMGSTELTTGQTYGSLPSPDDLTNVAWHSKQVTAPTPATWDVLMQKQFETKAAFALPVAYVRVPLGYVQGQPIPCENIIDIRPFLRTAELSYNERAAIVASNSPAGSNPFVTESRLQYLTNNLQTSISDLQGLAQQNEALSTANAAAIANLTPLVEQVKADVEGTFTTVTPSSLNHEGRIAALEALIGPGVSISVERTRLLPQPYTVFVDKSSRDFSTDPNTPTAFYIPSEVIPAGNNIVGVMFRVYARQGYGEEAVIYKLYMRGGAQSYRRIAAVGIGINDGTPRRTSAGVHSWLQDVTYIPSLPDGPFRYEMYVDEQNDEDNIKFDLHIDGYIYKEYVDAGV